MGLTSILIALVAGACIGAVLGFVGAGGAMVSVPIFIFLFDFSTAMATTASLAVVGLAALAGLKARLKSKDLLIKEGLVIWALGLSTNIGFGLLVPKIPEELILFGFSLVLFTAAYSMFNVSANNNAEKQMPFWILVVLSLVIGSLSGLFGIGGGFLAIPVLIRYFNVSNNKAAGTSLFIIALNCFTALGAKISIWDQINWGYPILISFAAILTSQSASKFAVKTSKVHLNRAFAVLLITIASITIFTRVFS